MNSLLLLWPLLVPLVLGGVALWLLLPHEGRRPWLLGGLCGVAALTWVLAQFLPPGGDLVRAGLFYVFAFGAVFSGVMMITDRYPVYAALWFAVVTLSTCGLFLLNQAPFLSAATIIVYAGAIVVTFLFVIMLAQQGGAAGYDRHAYQPTVATIAAFLLLGCLLYTLREWGQSPGDLAEATQGAKIVTVRPKFALPPADVHANPLSQPALLSADGANDLGMLQGVGRSLFGDYLFAVELAGTVLLIATIGTIALAPRRSQGTL